MKDHLNQHTDFSIIESLLPWVGRTFVDVGAERGSFSRWLVERGFNGVAIEPLPKHQPELDRLAIEGAVRVMNIAVDAEDGQRVLHIATDDHGVPLDHFHSLQRLENDTRVHHNRSISVMCRSLGSLLADGLIPTHVGILKIDTEGNDLQVLRGMGSLEADLVMVEYFTEGIYDGWRDASPLKLIVQAEALGYGHCLAIRRDLNGLEQITYQPLVFSHGEWGNLIFMRHMSYARLREALAEKLQPLAGMASQKVAELQKCCDERLVVIEQINAEAEKRLRIIETYKQSQSPD